MPLWRDDFEGSYESLAAAGVPVLFIWGTEDNVQPFEEAEPVLIQHFAPRGAACVQLDGAGHGLLYETQDVQQVASCADSWFKGSTDLSWVAILAASELQTAPPQESM